MRKLEIPRPYQLDSLLSASQWKGDNYNSAQEKGCALERRLLTLNSAKVCSMLFLFSMLCCNGHFQNSEANFRTFLVRNTQVLFLLLCITLLQSNISQVLSINTQNRDAENSHVGRNKNDVNLLNLDCEYLNFFEYSGWNYLEYFESFWIKP